MILSASGWRKVFAVSGNENDSTAEIGDENAALSIFAAEVFADYLQKKTLKKQVKIVLGMDTRPTGPKIVESINLALLAKKFR